MPPNKYVILFCCRTLNKQTNYDFNSKRLWIKRNEWLPTRENILPFEFHLKSNILRGIEKRNSFQKWAEFRREVYHGRKGWNHSEPQKLSTWKMSTTVKVVVSAAWPRNDDDHNSQMKWVSGSLFLSLFNLIQFRTAARASNRFRAKNT